MARVAVHGVSGSATLSIVAGGTVVQQFSSSGSIKPVELSVKWIRIVTFIIISLSFTVKTFVRSRFDATVPIVIAVKIWIVASINLMAAGVKEALFLEATVIVAAVYVTCMIVVVTEIIIVRSEVARLLCVTEGRSLTTLGEGLGSRLRPLGASVEFFVPEAIAVVTVDGGGR